MRLQHYLQYCVRYGTSLGLLHITLFSLGPVGFETPG